jgi:hypothetical protein
MRLPDGPVLELACGPSGSALQAAMAGRRITVVDVSEVALDLLAAQARRRRLDDSIELVNADLATFRPARARYALVLCTGYWDRAVFGKAATAVAERGLLGWEAFTIDALRTHPGMPQQWCLQRGEPSSLLPVGFEVLSEQDVQGSKRQLLARRKRVRDGRA